jgi:CRISPR type III-B/RAMP module RAMP protein Cmr1
VIRETYKIEIISPCFCAGADQSKAEIRAASIRGQLRWWFRLISQDPTEESIVFGSVCGDEDCSASCFSVRVADLRRSTGWTLPSINPNVPENYVWHFASVSGSTTRGGRGPRWDRSGYIPPKSTFILEIVWRRTPPSLIKDKFNLALNAFLSLGTLGLRGTRGLGALYCPQFPFSETLEQALRIHGVLVRKREHHDGFPSYEAVLKDYASWFRYDLRKEFKSAHPSPLGSSNPRQASAVRFRPFKRPDDKYNWLAYEAPHSRTLGKESRTSRQLLQSKFFTGPPPTVPALRRR